MGHTAYDQDIPWPWTGSKQTLHPKKGNISYCRRFLMPGMDDNVMVMFEVGQARGRVERELEQKV